MKFCGGGRSEPGKELVVRGHWTPLGSWVARIATRRCCEAEQGVREGRGPLVARNRHGGWELTSGGADAIPAV